MDPRRTDEVKGKGKVEPAARTRLWPWLRPPRNLNTLMSVVGLSGLFMAALTPRPGVPTPPAGPQVVPMPPFVWTVPGPLQSPVASDRFVVIPRADLDPGFLIAAPKRIDDAMIVSPDDRFGTRRR